MNVEDLRKILANHAKWSSNSEGGVMANLTEADLKRADLTGADLTGANLTGADLTGADLTGAKTKDGLYAGHAACYFDSHGGCGRQMLAVQFGPAITLYCGCFSGTPEELEKYIADGHAEHQESRTLALRFVLAALKMSKHQSKPDAAALARLEGTNK